jgi:hypothetical protein
MTKYADEIASARDAITEAGDTVLWQRAGTTLGTVPIVWLPSAQLSQWALQFGRELQVPIGYRYGLMPGDVPFIPASRDQVTGSDGVTRNIEMADVLAPDGTAILYYLYVSE